MQPLKKTLKIKAIILLLFSSSVFAQDSYNWEVDMITETTSLAIKNNKISQEEVEDKENNEEHTKLNFCSKEEQIFGIMIKELYGNCKVIQREFMDNNITIDFSCKNSKVIISADQKKNPAYTGSIDYFLDTPDISEKTLTKFSINQKNKCN